MQLKPIEQSFTVTYDYALHFTQGLFQLSNPLFLQILKTYAPNESVKLYFVIDKGVTDHHPTLVANIQQYCTSYSDSLEHTGQSIITGGEAAKNYAENVEQVLQAINDAHIDRHSFVVAIGGGALVDMVGYAATIAHRGVQLIRIPTTVLAQNDAAVGVKNSINYFGKKNFLGTFATPYAIINDSDFLKTLEQRDWIAGIAEAIKVALIQDADFFDFITKNASKLKNRDSKAMQYLIYKCAEMHMQHIAQGGDPFESGSSRPLDFGHWSAHKLEHMTKYSLRHGEAVAIGIGLDVHYAQSTGLIDKTTLDQIIKVLEEIGFDLHIPINGSAETEELLAGIEEFREHLGGKLTITLLKGIGHKQDVHQIDYHKMREAIATQNSKYGLKLS